MMHGRDEESHEKVAEALRAAAEAGRSRTPPVDVTAALMEGSRRRRTRRRRGQVFGSTLLVVLTAAILVPALALRSPRNDVAAHGTLPQRAGANHSLVPPQPACKGSWLHVSMSLTTPPKNGLEPPVTLHEVVTVTSTRRCTLSGWLRLRSVRESGLPYAAVKQRDLGAAATVVVRPGTAVTSRLTLRVPWYLPSGNLCAAWVTIGITPPGTHRLFHADILSGCGTGSLGKMHAYVSPLQ